MKRALLIMIAFLTASVAHGAIGFGPGGVVGGPFVLGTSSGPLSMGGHNLEHVGSGMFSQIGVSTVPVGSEKFNLVTTDNDILNRLTFTGSSSGDVTLYDLRYQFPPFSGTYVTRGSIVLHSNFGTPWLEFRDPDGNIGFNHDFNDGTTRFGRSIGTAPDAYVHGSALESVSSFGLAGFEIVGSTTIPTFTTAHDADVAYLYRIDASTSDAYVGFEQITNSNPGYGRMRRVCKIDSSTHTVNADAGTSNAILLSQVNQCVDYYCRIDPTLTFGTWEPLGILTSTAANAGSGPFTNATSSTSLSMGAHSLTSVNAISGLSGGVSSAAGIGVSLYDGNDLIANFSSNTITTEADISNSGYELGRFYPNAHGGNSLTLLPQGNAANRGSAYLQLLGPADDSVADQAVVLRLPDTMPSAGQTFTVTSVSGGEADFGWATAGGGTVYNSAADGRLTTQSGVSISSSDRTSQGTIYYTPYSGNHISLYISSAWTDFTFSELSKSLTVSSGSNYDVFVGTTGGSAALFLSAAWTDDTTRSDAISFQNGVPVLTSDKTKRLVGTIRGSGSNVVEDSSSKRFVWNYDHRVRRALKVIDATSSWSYSSTTVRSWNSSTANRVEVVSGLAGTAIDLHANVHFYNSGGGLYDMLIGVNRTNGNDAQVWGSQIITNGGFSRQYAHSDLTAAVPLGYTFYQVVEACESSTCNVENADSGTHLQGGLTGMSEN